ncbi:MAG TPA: hypothetical protein VFS42_05415 [Burkholderiaceae bacterium]|nr:hypothetical protein [Burkholderiaceae bacterium]
MATLTASNGVKTASCDAALNRLTTGTTDATPDFAFLNASNAILGICNFSATPFGASVINGSTGKAEASANTIANSGAPTAGTITKGRWRNRDNATEIEFDIALSGAALNLGSVDIPAGASHIAVSNLKFIWDVGAG